MERSIDGSRFFRLIEGAGRYLAARRDSVNALNVFPVPDGDTGDNMSMTVEAAIKEMRRAGEANVGRLASALAAGSLRGARGNSGVILSQIFRGYSRSLESKPELTAANLADALERGSETAYRAVMKPIEGTILTVAREAARGAKEAVGSGEEDPANVLKAAIRRGGVALEHTPDLLPVLKRAGVVDAGGRGYLYVLEGMLATLTGAFEIPAVVGAEEVPEEAVLPVGAVPGAVPAGAEEIPFPYDIEFFVWGAEIPIERLREGLGRLGDSVLVIPTEGGAKVHVHTDDPGSIFTLAVEIGELDDIVMKNMRRQQEAWQQNRLPQAGNAEARGEVFETAGAPPEAQTAATEAAAEAPPRRAVVAVAPGSGWQELFQTLGARQVVLGGQSMNPSTDEIARAVRETGAAEVFLLPNNPNVVLACRQAAELVTARVHVVPTRTAPEGLAALMTFEDELASTEIQERMQEAAWSIKSGEVTHAARDTRWDGVRLTRGTILGLSQGSLAATGAEPQEVLLNLLKSMVTEEDEVITLYWGADIDEKAADAARAAVEAAFPHVEVETYSGGQPHYYYLLAVE